MTNTEDGGWTLPLAFMAISLLRWTHKEEKVVEKVGTGDIEKEKEILALRRRILELESEVTSLQATLDANLTNEVVVASGVHSVKYYPTPMKLSGQKQVVESSEANPPPSGTSVAEVGLAGMEKQSTENESSPASIIDTPEAVVSKREHGQNVTETPASATSTIIQVQNKTYSTSCALLKKCTHWLCRLKKVTRLHKFLQIIPQLHPLLDYQSSPHELLTLQS